MTIHIDRRTFVATSATAGLASILQADTAEKKVEGEVRSSGLHHIGVFASNPDVTIQFFTEALGFVVRYQWPSAEGKQADSRYKFTLAGAMLDAGDGNYVEVFPRPAGTENQSPVFPMNHFALRTSNIEESYRKAIANGGMPHTLVLEGGEWNGTPLEIEMEGNPPLQAKIAFLRGPDDILIEFFESGRL